MTDTELRNEIRRGLLVIIRALMKRYAMTWLDFIPADDRASMTYTCLPPGEMLVQGCAVISVGGIPPVDKA